MIQVGSRVYIVPDDKRNAPYYRTVISIGRKYITVADNSSCNRFDIQTKYSVCDKDGWNPRLNIYESKAAYDDMRELQRRKNRLLSKIEDKLPNTSLEKLEQICKIL